MKQDNARQHNTRRDNIIHDKTIFVNRQHANTICDKMGQDKTIREAIQYTIRQDKTLQDMTIQYNTTHANIRQPKTTYQHI